MGIFGGRGIILAHALLEWQMLPVSYHHLSYRTWARFKSFLNYLTAVTCKSQLAILPNILHPSFSPLLSV